MKWSALLLIVLLAGLGGCIRTGNGVAQDTVYQMQYDGVIWKTYDVWLTNDHPTESHNAIYCPEVNDKATIEALQAAIESKKQCTISYHNEMFVAPWRCNSGTIIDKVEC